jgi:phospholipase C
MPYSGVGEHPVHGKHVVWRGMCHVTSVVNAVMQSPAWNSTAVFITWDDWGGFYDHVRPIRIDGLGYGIRVPGLLISPWVHPGTIDSQTLTSDAYLKLIEALFLNGRALDPATDGRPDPRPTVRERVPALGNLLKEFSFSRKPLPPLLLDPTPLNPSDPTPPPGRDASAEERLCAPPR